MAPVNILPILCKLLEQNIHDKIYDCFDKLLPKDQCRFRKRYATQQCLKIWLKNWGYVLKNWYFSSPSICSLKSFCSLFNDLLTAKLHDYGIEENSLKLFLSSLEKRKQRICLKCTYNIWKGILLRYIRQLGAGWVVAPSIFYKFVIAKFFS